ncbi:MULTISPECIES: glucosaminidase domain-containing protein [unclassified Halorhodospira]|uniref:glucosaminidase domain-containing protein n=1 Tax=unclassified Halorhodospira TaxID=2626748 RepID=UPI001EE7F040|nr:MULTISPECIES: glucosaminidase domain-containing protein [unclassified Halorhodospira]MCG5541293.1 glucosaminidase domain-containing protein [Halorhodospira sp. M39old]MCG5546511.1 glucosaminidase domain-containing protein [Halorhodospira sp. M38]
MNESGTRDWRMGRWVVISAILAVFFAAPVAYWGYQSFEERVDGQPPPEVVDPEPFRVPELTFIEADSSEVLLERLREHGGEQWPPDEVVPAVTAGSFPEDLDEVDVQTRKEVFFRILTPIVLAENARLREARAFVVEAGARRDELDGAAGERLEALAEHYRVDLDDDDAIEVLLHRLDEIPPDMALAQAANESGWGTSRFTRQANNLFGEWTWTQEEGLVPERRGEGESHRIRVFPSLQRSVRSYYFTLNVGHAYDDLRDLRAEMRDEARELDGEALSAGLTAYSERGQAYVEEVRSMIRFNELARINGLRLDEVEHEPTQLAEAGGPDEAEAAGE